MDSTQQIISKAIISVLVKAEVVSKIGVEVWRIEVVSIISMLVVKTVVLNAKTSNEGFIWIIEEKSNPIVVSVVNEAKSNFRDDPKEVSLFLFHILI